MNDVTATTGKGRILVVDDDRLVLATVTHGLAQAGYEVIVTADHGQSDRGHHGGTGEDQQHFALYYFGAAKGPEKDVLLDQLQLAPTVLSRLGVPVPDTMSAKPFLL